jgi:hypothetical protein
VIEGLKQRPEGCLKPRCSRVGLVVSFNEVSQDTEMHKVNDPSMLLSCLPGQGDISLYRSCVLAEVSVLVA